MNSLVKRGLVRLNLKPVSCSGKIISNTHHAFTVVHLQWNHICVLPYSLLCESILYIKLKVTVWIAREVEVYDSHILSCERLNL